MCIFYGKYRTLFEPDNQPREEYPIDPLIKLSQTLLVIAIHNTLLCLVTYSLRVSLWLVITDTALESDIHHNALIRWLLTNAETNSRLSFMSAKPIC